MNTIKNKIISFILMLSVIFPLCIITYSCTEEIILSELQSDKKTVVIESWINNLDSVIKVKVSYSSPIPITMHNYNSVAIRDAIVIISDNTGKSDSLRFTIDTGGYWSSYDYQTSEIIGIPGRTYFLYVKVGDQEFFADAEMLVPTAIDTIYYSQYRNETKNEDRFAPIIKFHDDTTLTNFYMSGSVQGGDEFSMTLFSDELSDKGVITTNLNKHVSRDWWRRDLGGMFDPVNPTEYCLYTITEEVFKNLEAMINQIESDGGLYSPAPGNLPTNIRGGALGFFGAVAGSTITYIP